MLCELGINKKDICWGIKGSKEFARNNDNNSTYFYDFTIKSLKFTIEYNGIFWHAREDLNWRGFGNKDENIDRNKKKIALIEDLGYNVIVVWSDDDLEKARNKIYELIKNKIYENISRVLV